MKIFFFRKSVHIQSDMYIKQKKTNPKSKVYDSEDMH